MVGWLVGGCNRFQIMKDVENELYEKITTVLTDCGRPDRDENKQVRQRPLLSPFYLGDVCILNRGSRAYETESPYASFVYLHRRFFERA